MALARFFSQQTKQPVESKLENPKKICLVPFTIHFVWGALRKCIEDRERAHELQVSSKFHPEFAGVSIEYGFGRSKWYYKSTPAMSSDGLMSGSLDALSRDVVTLGHTRLMRERRVTTCARNVPGRRNSQWTS